MVPAALVMLLLDAAALANGGTSGPLRWISAILICAFYVLVVGSYLRRGPAIATGGSATGHVVAVLATIAPFAFPQLRGAIPGPGQQLSADVILLARLAWSAWSLWFLGRNLSVLAQARAVADRGPYRLVRHPLYTGEIVSALGLALSAGSPAGFAVWLALCAMQAYRALLRRAAAAREPARVPELPRAHGCAGPRHLLADVLGYPWSPLSWRGARRPRSPEQPSSGD